MLPNHAPLVVAEQFGTLEALYPGRIDLGLGRAPGGDWQTMRALRRDLAQTGDDFPELLAELQGYLGAGSEAPVRHFANPLASLSVGASVRAVPGQGSQVPITLLGSSTFSAQLAAAKGLPFAFAAHFAPELMGPASRLYREEFREGGYPEGAALTKPYLMVAVPVIAAETDAEARRLFTSAQQRFLRLVRGQSVEMVAPLDDPEMMDSLWRADERAAVESKLREAIVGSNATVKAGLEKLVRATGADEVIVVTDTYRHEDRLESYRRVAEVAREVAVGQAAFTR
jgi:luciferase family oxidoreductase group 1